MQKLAAMLFKILKLAKSPSRLPRFDTTLINSMTNKGR